MRSLLLLLLPMLAHATPGPESVVVIANANVAGSVSLAQQYAQARDVPDRQVCLLDLPAQVDVSLDEFRSLVLEPLRACLDAAGVRDRIEAALLMRGMPLRVQIPVPEGGTQSVSLAAALGAWDSTLSDGTELIGQPPGRNVDCGGSTCYTGAWQNGYQGLAFQAGYVQTRGGVDWRPILVTMLHGRSDEDAARLIESALDGEAAPPRGTFLFMDGSDPARAALDWEAPMAIAALAAAGISDAEEVPFDRELAGRTLAAFFTGSDGLGAAIEGNTFLPGALVDNLTSFGALPINFEASGESQVSIARWVAKGVAGAHGTVDEPINNCFPSRLLIADYLDGATLAEAYHSRLPFAYWRNLVLGDPMAAPYANRPVVTIDGLSDHIAGAVMIQLSAQGARPISSLTAYLDGVEIAGTDGSAIGQCLVANAGSHQLLVVAWTADDGVHAFRPKGWSAIRFSSDGTMSNCSLDAGVGDASVLVDGGVASTPAGCGCHLVEHRGSPCLWLAIATVILRRRAR